MFVDAAPPPAIHAPAKPCASYTPVDLHISLTTIATSPDCQWQLVLLGEATPEALKAQRDALPQAIFTRQGNLFVINIPRRTVISRFQMDRSAAAHWQGDGRALIINYFEGSGSSRPLVVSLRQTSEQAPKDLSRLIYPDVLKRLKKTEEQVYHYYVHYIADLGDRVRISAQPDYTLKGEYGPGRGRCFIYTIDKATFSTFRFERELPQQGDNLNCPHKPDEKSD